MARDLLAKAERETDPEKRARLEALAERPRAGIITLVRNLLGRMHVAGWGVPGKVRVKKVEEYLEHASECRELARAAHPAHREQLEEMAQTWEQLAEARKGKIKKQLKAKYVSTST